VKIAYLDCFSGISGDMFLAALVDAGVPFSVLENAVSALGIEAELKLRRVDRSGIDAAKIDVMTTSGELGETAHHGTPASSKIFDHTHDHHHGDERHSHSHTNESTHENGLSHSHEHTHENNHDHPHVHGRSLSVIRELIQTAPLAAEVKTTAIKAFELLGVAEAKIHNVPIETIHFHEVGAVDAIADIVACSAGIHWLKIHHWFCSPLNVGGGHVHCAHGQFPVPAPATLELLRDLPIYSSGIKKELVTPTGAALLRALEVTSSNFPAMKMTSTGYGAGSRDPPGQPNVLRLVIGESAASNPQPSTLKIPERIGIIETTIDDATPELLSYVADLLLAAGASDVYRIPIQMKKGRSGVQLTVLCNPDKAEFLQKLVFRETTTLGLRYREEEKKTLARSFVAVETQWGAVRIKLGLFEDGGIANYAPEYEDCRIIAEKHATPLKLVMQAAVAAYLAKENLTKATQAVGSRL
jgi:uncharacterized protein (TIGR00299 family) protein